MLTRSTAPLLVALTLFACSNPAPEGGSGLVDKADALPSEGLEIVRCWMEPDGDESFFGRDALWCQVPDLPGGFEPASVTIDIPGAGGHRITEVGVPVQVANLLREDLYPIELNVHLNGRWVEGDVDTIGAFGNAQAGVLIESADEMPRTAPVSFRLPVEVWEIQLHPAMDEYRIGTLSVDGELDIAPFVYAGFNSRGTTVPYGGRASVFREAQTVFVLVPVGAEAAPSGVALSYTGSTDLEFGAELNGSGIYEIRDDGLHRIGSLAAEPTDPGTEPAPEPEPEPEPVDPDPTCGDAGQSCCGGYGGDCDAGSYCRSGQCEACGEAGDSCCGGYGGSCNAGSYCRSGQCDACGQAGESCCGGYGGTCEAGAYCRSGGCDACGQIGQSCCGGYGGTCEGAGECSSGTCR